MIEIVVSRMGIGSLEIPKYDLPKWAVCRLKDIKCVDTIYIHISKYLIYEVEFQMFFGKLSVHLRPCSYNVDTGYIRGNMAKVFVDYDLAIEFIHDIITKFGDDKSKEIIRKKGDMCK